MGCYNNTVLYVFLNGCKCFDLLKTCHLHITMTAHENESILNYQQLNYLFNITLRLTTDKTPKLQINGFIGFFFCKLVTGSSPHKGPAMWKTFPCYDTIMIIKLQQERCHISMG